MINVLADKHLYRLTKFLPSNIDLTLYNPAEPLKAIPEGTQALLIRTVTKINPVTFPAFPDSLRFIGTGSAGFDHIDLNHLDKHNIAFANAGGCNARSVAEYVAVALLLWAEEQHITLCDKKVGIIGVGHTGSAVEHLLHKLNVKTVLYDPPREKRDSNFTSAPINDVLNSDILTFHTPLTTHNSHPTFHWLDEKKLQNHSFDVVINASRGGVVDEKAVLNAYKEKSIANYILDVWENEPVFCDKIARNAFIKTPHIAGYSVQAKERASQLIVEAMTHHFSMSGATISTISKDANLPNKMPSSFYSLTDALTYCHPIEDYEIRLKMIIGRMSAEKKEGFNKIRTTQPLRNELSCMKLPVSYKKRYNPLRNLGVQFK